MTKMNEIQLDKRSIQVRGEKIFSAIKIHSRVEKKRYRLHDLGMALWLAEDASKRHYFSNDQQQSWAKAGLEFLADDYEEAWQADHEAHYLMSYYVTYYLKEWAEDYVLDILQGATVNPKDYTEQLAERFVEAWEEIHSSIS